MSCAYTLILRINAHTMHTDHIFLCPRILPEPPDFSTLPILFSLSPLCLKMKQKQFKEHKNEGQNKQNTVKTKQTKEQKNSPQK